MLGGWRTFRNEKPKSKQPFAFLKGTRGHLLFENGCWEFISGRGEDKITVPAAILADLLFMDDFIGKKK